MSINLPSAIAVSLTTKNFSAGTLVSEGLAQHASGTPANIARIVVRYFNISLFRPTSAMRLRRLAADSLKRLVQLHHSAWCERLSPENWCLGVENGAFFGFGDDFGVFLAILGRKTSTFPSFFVAASHLRRGVEVLRITPHLLNVTPHFRREAT